MRVTRLGSLFLVGWLGACAGPARPAPAPVDDVAAAPKVEEGHIATEDGTRLYYRKIGTGPVVAIVPGASFYAGELDALGRRHTVILYDMRGRGRSDRLAALDRVSIQHDVADLERVRAHFGAEKITPIGWSYLGLVVMLYAAEHPAHVDRVVQIGPLMRQLGTEYPADQKAAPDPAWDAELQAASTSELAKTDPAAHCAAFWAVFRRSLVGDASRVDRIPDACALENEWPVNLEPHFQALFTSIFKLAAPSWQQFAALEISVLTIHGTQDRQSPYGAGREWSAHLRDGRLLTVPGAAHMVWIDAPDVVVPAIDEFLAGGWPRSSQDVPSP